AGFYYIPGTETCLRVGGFMRYQVNMGNEFEIDTLAGVARGESDYGWQKQAIFSVQLDARTETELGTLRAFLDARLSHGSTVQLDKAYLSLGGLTIGRASNAFDFDFGGEQDLLGDGTFNVVQYTFNGGNGFSATISLDDDGDVISGAGAFDTPGLDNGADFVPNVSANIQYAAGPLALGLYGAYDNDTEEGVIKVLAAYSFSDADKLSVGGYWASGGTYVLGGDFGGYLAAATAAGAAYRNSIPASGEWSLQAEYKHTFNEKLAASLGVVYINNVAFLEDFAPGADLNFWRVGTTIDYTVVPGFLVKTSLNYNKFDGDGADFLSAFNGPGDNFGDGFFSGFVRFQRDF
ncbi:hypothetical protein ASD44_02135, partial [Mesorhizobium sp. Root554]